MGYHSDIIENLYDETGVIIISLGATREISFRNIEKKEIKKSYPLSCGSLLYMSQEIQTQWTHAIPKQKECGPRMSLTFRKIVK